MKVSECHNCPETYREKSKHYRCRVLNKDIRVITVCPKEPLRKPWTQAEIERLPLLVGEGTHPRKIALILGHPYSEVEKRMSEVEKTCGNCGRLGYCGKQYKDGCGLTQWCALTPKQIKDMILMTTRKEGLGFNY